VTSTDPAAADANLRMGRVSARSSMWVSLLLGVLVALAACGASQANATPPHPARTTSTTVAEAQLQIPAKAGTRWALTWSGGFNRPGALKKWIYFKGGTGWGLSQLQWYDANNARINKSGQLVITANKAGSRYKCSYGPCKYTSARMETLTKFSQKYGMFEARIKLPPGRGLWPAFWVEGTNIYTAGWPTCGEIDIAEPNGKNPYLLQAFAHAKGFNHIATLSLPQPMTAGFHTYGITWSPGGVTWYFDGHAYSHMKAYRGWPFSRQFFIILDLAVGGGYAGPPNASTPFPARMTVDWIRVYRQVRA
jgi:beta-glucanase (GH16 family)